MVQTATLPLMLKQLNLSSIARHWQGMLDQAERNAWNPARYLSALCEQELADRHSRRIARKSQGIAPPGGQKPGELRLRRGAEPGSGPDRSPGRLHRLAPPGTQRPAVRRRRCGQEPSGRRHRLRSDRAQRACALLRHLDDFGFVKNNEQETQVLFELIAHRYETGSLIITSNQPFADRDRIFPDQMMTVAAVDRLVHHATIIEVASDSYRRKEAIARLAGETTGPQPAPPG